MRSGVYEQFLRLDDAEQEVFLARLRADDAGRRHTAVSAAQRQLWVLNRTRGGSDAYTSPLVYRLRGQVDADLLGAALERLCWRHEVLRTRFVDVAGEPVALVSGAPAPLRVTDLSSLPPEDRAATALESVRAEVAAPFDLASSPLLRCRFLRIADDDAILALIMHHAVTDGWSVTVLQRDLAAIYGALRAGSPPRLAPLPLQYIDFAAWQDERIASGHLDTGLAYWRAELAGAPTQLGIGTDHPRPPRQSVAGDVVTLRLPEPLVAALLGLGRAHAATPFVTFCTLYALLLREFGAGEDILLGVPEAGRGRPELADLVGPFVNMIVVRARVSGSPTFADALRAVRRSALGGLRHADVPFEHVVAELAGSRSLDRNPLCQTMITLDELGEEPLRLDGAVGEYIEVITPPSKFDLALFVRLLPAGAAEIQLHYASELFERASAAAMLARFAQLADEVIASPQAPLGTPVAPPARDPAGDSGEDMAAGSSGAPAAADETERGLHAVWAQILGRSDFGVDEDFFALGGTSMAALRVVIAARRELGVDLEPAVVFDAPTVRRMARQLRAHPAATPPARSGNTPPTPPDATVPLSVAQRRMWFLDQMDGAGTAAYHVPVLVVLRAPLNRAAARGALDGVCRRHDVLRLRFLDVAGEPVARCSDEPAPLRFVDARSEGAPDPGARCAAELAEEFSRPFELTRDSPLRCLVVTLAEEHQVVLLTGHHIVIDGWSQEILRRDFAAAYDGLCRGEPARLPDPGASYADFVAWQRDYLDSARFATDLEYWCTALRGAPPFLDVPVDQPRTSRPRRDGAAVPFRLPPALAGRLAEVARAHRATTFMLYHTVWAVVLDGFAGQQDVLIGVPESGRSRAEFAGVVGMFVNTLVLRTDLSGDPTFAELLLRVRERASAAYARSAVPFERLVEELDVGRTLERTPLFQAYMSFQAATDLAAPARGEEAETHLRQVGLSAKFDLDLAMGEASDGSVAGAIAYATDLFERRGVAAMAEAFVCVAESVAADATQRIGRLPLMGGATRAALTRPPRPALPLSVTLVHEFVERQAEEIPDAVAVRGAAGALTYRELDQAANRLAARLVELGVGAGTLVGLCLPRDEHLICAVLAVLKAGGGYVPLDPTLPPARLEFLVSDSGAALVLTRRELAGRFAARTGRLVFLDDELRCPPAGGRGERLPPRAGAEDIAYVLYTSGSTGRPKGVVVEHRSVVSLVEYYRRALTAEQVAVTLCASPLGFDASVLEIFACLALGGTLVMADSVLELTDLPEASSVTLVQTVPSLMWELLALGPLPDSLRTVCIGGESLPGALVERIYAAGAVERLYNIYGPTEYTVDATWSAVAPGTATPAIGTPLPGTRAYVLDRSGRLVPPGARGELHLAGPGLARGYLRRPELTRERFVPDPFQADGSRMYRTGDQVRWRADGELQFLGRGDRQVKLRGRRIELGELERALADLPEVAQAVAAVREPAGAQGQDHPLLVAYVRAAGMWDEARVRATLRARLPEYLIPAVFVPLGATALTPNGKLDVTALPAPARTGPSSPVPPSSPTECSVAAVWREVLGVDSIGVDDNFFDLGGTSFGLVRLRARIGEMLGHRLELLAFYEHPTVAGIAAALDGALAPDGAGGGEAPRTGSGEDARGERLQRGRARLAARRRGPP